MAARSARSCFDINCIGVPGVRRDRAKCCRRTTSARRPGRTTTSRCSRTSRSRASRSSSSASGSSTSSTRRSRRPNVDPQRHRPHAGHRVQPHGGQRAERRRRHGRTACATRPAGSASRENTNRQLRQDQPPPRPPDHRVRAEVLLLDFSRTTWGRSASSDQSDSAGEGHGPPLLFLRRGTSPRPPPPRRFVTIEVCVRVSWSSAQVMCSRSFRSAMSAAVVLCVLVLGPGRATRRRPTRCSRGVWSCTRPAICWGPCRTTRLRSRRSPTAPTSAPNLGAAYVGLGRIDEGIAQYRKALEVEGRPRDSSEPGARALQVRTHRRRGGRVRARPRGRPGEQAGSAAAR